jgi:hydrogenase/urease accessory protein HupE
VSVSPYFHHIDFSEFIQGTAVARRPNWIERMSNTNIVTIPRLHGRGLDLPVAWSAKAALVGPHTVVVRAWRRAGSALLLLCGALLTVVSAQAHMMAAQRGTLNIVGSAAFLVLSVPVTALQGVDDDGDGALSKTELIAHQESIGEQVRAGIQLRGAGGMLPLQLMMLDIAPPANHADTPGKQLVALGRFQLGPAVASQAPPHEAVSGGLSLRFSLFGKTSAEQQQDLTITRQDESQWIRMTPTQPEKALLPSAAAVFGEYAALGATHVLSGADHMIFLLVVLLMGWRWRPLLAALTCFTAGHAITLAACVWGGFSVSDRIVEPAIAATLVGLGMFDAWAQRLAWAVRPQVRLALIFVCALIHGLGLAGALSDLTQWAPGTARLGLALFGFNLGIELAQIGVAALAGLVLWLLARLAGLAARQRVMQAGSVIGLLAGTFWLIERLAQGA